MPLSQEQLLNRRNGLRTRSERVAAAATNVLNNPDQHDEAVLQAHLNTLVDIRTQLDVLDQQVLDNLDDAAMTEDEMIESAVPAHQVQSRLPKLTLPQFSGEVLTWSTFWDSFDSSIHSQDYMSAVDKFKHLRSLLKGDALRAIAGLAVTNANYDAAIELIKQRFGQPQSIINAHVEGLVNLSKATDDTVKLRTLYDSAEIHIRSLDALQITPVQYGAVLTPMLLSKLPDEIRLLITRKNDGAIGDLDVLRDLLRSEIEVRELSNLSAKKSSEKAEKDNSRNFTTGALVTSSAAPSRFKRKFCGYCRLPTHSPFQCSKYPTPDGKRQKAIQDKLCLNCLHKEHDTKDCRSNFQCKRCHQRHHTSMCSMPDPTVQYQGPQPTPVQVVNVNPSQILVSSSTPIWMQTALVSVQDTSGTRRTVRALFDCASHRSYVTQSLVNQLSLPTSCTEFLKLAPFGGQAALPQRYNVVNVQGSNVADDVFYDISAVVVPEITYPIYRAALTSHIPALDRLILADPPRSGNCEWLGIDLLIGLDHYWSLVHDQILRFPGHGLAAQSSVFGWLVSGTSGAIQSGGPAESNVLLAITSAASDIDNCLTRFWEVESLEPGCSPFDTPSLDHSVLERFEDTIQLKDGRYEVGLPWKDQTQELPTNYSLCRKRFNSLINRLHREDVMQQYNDVISQQVRMNFIEKVDDPCSSNGQIHYIPHHPVIKKDHETTKLRIVYDASAKQSQMDPSLNDNLYSGPNLIIDLMGILLIFRSYHIVLLADIEKAFLQVGLRPVDRDATRFLWLKDTSKPATDDNIQVWRFRRVPFGATSSPFLLAATIRHHLNNCPENAAQMMKNHFYVDNLVSGTETVEEACDFYVSAKDILKQAGMNLREWVSNEPEVMKFIPEVDRAKGTSVKVLGLQWSVPDDIIQLKGVPEMNDIQQPTKRQILKTISKVFDPLGIAAPVVIPAKVFIQSLWKLKIGWDDCPPSVLIDEWRRLSKQLAELGSLKLPRRLFVNTSSQLHVFADASNKAYGAVAYIRTVNDGYTITQLVACKSRVTPVKTMSTPRLELLAACLACKLAVFVKDTFPNIKFTQIWSDSQVVLHWIHRIPAKQGIFVANRVKQIQEFGFNFRYCPTFDNPADLPSRGKDTADLKTSTLWWYGPPWLQSEETSWPELMTYESIPSNEQDVPTVVTVVPVVAIHPPFGIISSNFSSLAKLLRVTSYCLRFIKKCRGGKITSDTISAEENTSSLKIWITHIQETSYHRQFTLLKTGKTDDVIRHLGLYSDGEVLKCHGRFQHSNATTNNDLILLPRANHITNLVISDCHHKLYHQGTRHTLTALRQTYWVPQGRQQVRQVLKRCLICKLWEGQPYSLPDPPSLPFERVAKAPPFTFTGCDFAGPLYTFDTAGQSGKTYICLFTCAVTRAIHLELVSEMTTECFLLALKRFIARRGTPSLIVSDNAKTFKLAQLTVGRIWLGIVTSPDTENYVASQGIAWKFNIPRAPWWGGFFERLVGLVKRTIKKAIGKTKLTTVVMATLLTEVEAILNSRPLTYVHDELSNGQPLTPSNFLSDSRKFGVPTPELTADPDFGKISSADQLVKRFRNRQKLVDRFWNIWSSEYLSTLRERHHQTKVSRRNPYCPQVGDVVLIKDDGTKRAHWKLAVVTYLFRNKIDGLVRAAQLRSSCQKLFQRPISLLYPLEINEKLINEDPHNIQSEKVEFLPQRSAAIKAKRNIQNILSAEMADN